MTEQNTSGRTLTGVLEEIAASRGYTLAGAAEEARRNGYAYTPADVAGGAGGFGNALDSVLGLEDSERRRVVAGVCEDWSERSFGPPTGFGEPAVPGAGRYRGDNPRENGAPVFRLPSARRRAVWGGCCARGLEPALLRAPRRRSGGRGTRGDVGERPGGDGRPARSGAPPLAPQRCPAPPAAGGGGPRPRARGGAPGGAGGGRARRLRGR